MKSYGLLLDPIVTEKDYIFGGFGSLNGDILQPDGQWRDYLPQGESQLNFGFDPNACVSFGTLNAVEILLRRHYPDLNNNFADRFLAKVSLTTPQGNSPQQVAEALRKLGAPQEELWPITSDLSTWERFYTEIPHPIQTIALQFVAEYGFKHEYVPTNATPLKQALQYSPLGIAVSAWVQDANGLYTSPFPNNHWVVLIGYKDGEYWEVFDSYSQDGTYIKRLAWDHSFSQAKRYAITIQADTKSPSFWDFLTNLYNWAFGIPSVAPYTPPTATPAPQPVQSPPTPKLTLLDAAKAALGTDASPADKASDEFGCAETVSDLIQKVYPDFKTYLSTADLYTALKADSRFKETLDPTPGAVIISPRTPSTNGHCGIFLTADRIASNNSLSGKFDDNYSLSGWVTAFRQNRGLHIYIFASA